MAWNETGRLLAVGEAKTLQAQYPDAERIDAGDATVIPGLIDAHGHLMGLGYARSEEHTSELQSLMRLSYAVFCLKKTKHLNRPTHTTAISHLTYSNMRTHTTYT